MPAKPVKPVTVGGLPVTPDPLDKPARPPRKSLDIHLKAATKQSKVSVYAKAVAAFIVTALGAIGAWSTTLGSGPITRNEWIGLAVALAAPFGAASGVAITTNAPADSEAGMGLLEFIVAVFALLILLVIGLAIAGRIH